MISYKRSITFTLFLPLFFSGLFPQNDNEPFFKEKHGKEYYIQRSPVAPVIDGFINDPCWVQVMPIIDFLQDDPNNLSEPTEKTEVYLTYDDKSLYVAARLYDSSPSDIVRQLAPQDDWYGAFDEMADWFNIDLDTRHDHQTGFSFAVNASGVMYDAMVYNDEEIDGDWDAIWLAEVQIDELGWSVELEIPFSNLSFYKDKKLTWGMNLTRFIQRNYEIITWVTFPLDVQGISSKYGHLNGLEGIYPPSKFKFTPNFFGSTSMYSDIRLIKSLGKSDEPSGHRLHYVNDSKANFGLDISYRLNPSSKFMLSLNPDFSQVESDPAYVNLTAFETYFKEKRPFFLQDFDLFETPIEIFYSRRISESDWQIVIVDTNKCSSCTTIDTTYDFQKIPYKISTAGKFTGKTKTGFSYAIMGAITEPKIPQWDNAFSSHRMDWYTQMNKSKDKKYIVSRIKKDLFAGNSFIGFMSTSSIEDDINIFSVDGMTNFFDNQVGLDAQMIMSSKEHKGMYGRISYSPPGYFSGWIDYNHYDKGLELNDLGFLWRDDYTQTKLGIMFQSFETSNVVRYSSIILQGDIEENSDGLTLGKSIELIYDIKFKNLWSFGGGYKKYMDAYDDRKIFTDLIVDCCPTIFLPEVKEYSINISTDQHKLISAFISFRWQKSSINDKYNDQYIELSYKPSPYLQLSTAFASERLFQKNHFLEAFYELELEKIPNMLHYIFSNRDGEMDVLTFRITSNINRKLSFQSYLELFSNRDNYSEYVEYLPSENEYEDSTQFILGWDPFIVPNINEDGTPNEYAGSPMPVYTKSIDSVSRAHSYVDPNHELDFTPNLTSIRFNGVLKWNYMKGSNLYIVYSMNKAVNGQKFNGMRQLNDFITYNKYEPWVEVLRDQTFMIKIDYWFEN